MAFKPQHFAFGQVPEELKEQAVGVMAITSTGLNPVRGIDWTGGGNPPRRTFGAKEGVKLPGTSRTASPEWTQLEGTRKDRREQ